MSWDVRQGDCLDVLRDLPDASVDSVVTDGPYELGFMGRAWDASGIVYRVELWREVLRVLKPGGHLVSFGGTRTYHRMACAVEDAAFDIRDSLHWFYGSGFPKSLDAGRAIDESFCAIQGRHYWHEASLPKGARAQPGDHVCARTPQGEAWDGWGTALKPGHEPIILARKPLAGTVAANVLEHGTGGLNIDACRLGERDRTDYGLVNATRTQGSVYGAPSASADFDAEAGRWPPNVVLSHLPECRDGACEPGCVVAELDRQSGYDAGAHGRSETAYEGIDSTRCMEGGDRGARGPVVPSKGGASRFFPTFTWEPGDFPPFLYCAKPSRAERDAGLEDVIPTSGGEATEREDGAAGTRSPRAGAGRNGGAKNFHPTVKPIRLMEWLVRLVTPPGGLVLDPFVGSGTTGCAAVRAGFDFLGVEREEPYVQLAVRRIALAAGAPRAKGLGELVRLKPAKDTQAAPQLGLFATTGTEG